MSRAVGDPTTPPHDGRRTQSGRGTPSGATRTGLSSVVGVYFRKHPLAEEVGFEPTEGFPSHDFQSCRFGRSRTPPRIRYLGNEMNTGLQGYPSRADTASGSLFDAEVQSGGRVPCDDRSRTESGVEASSSQWIVLGATDRLTIALDLGISQCTVSMRAWQMRPRPRRPLTA